jgi:hypothetical protein
MTVGGETLNGRRNLIINGAMKVAQRSTSATGLGNSSGYNALDRFGYFASGAGRFTKAQVAVTDLVGFTNAMKHGKIEIIQKLLETIKVTSLIQLLEHLKLLEFKWRLEL